MVDGEFSFPGTLVKLSHRPIVKLYCTLGFFRSRGLSRVRVFLVVSLLLSYVKNALSKFILQVTYPFWKGIFTQTVINTVSTDRYSLPGNLRSLFPIVRIFLSRSFFR